MKWLGKKIFPEKNKSIASHQAIVSAPLPEKLIVPLINHKGDLLTACVTVGQRVLKGEILTAINDLQKPPVHAATSGTVMAITEHPIVHAELKTAPCIVIGVDGLDKWGRQGEALIRPVSSFFHKEERGKNERNFFGDKYISQKVSAQQLREKCHQAGIVGFGGAGFPTALKLTNQNTHYQWRGM